MKILEKIFDLILNTLDFIFNLISGEEYNEMDDDE